MMGFILFLLYFVGFIILMQTLARIAQALEDIADTYAHATKQTAETSGVQKRS